MHGSEHLDTEHETLEEGFKKFQDTVEEKGYTLEGLGWEGGAIEPAAISAGPCTCS